MVINDLDTDGLAARLGHSKHIRHCSLMRMLN